jgi:hypothetical protein
MHQVFACGTDGAGKGKSVNLLTLFTFIHVCSDIFEILFLFHRIQYRSLLISFHWNASHI